MIIPHDEQNGSQTSTPEQTIDKATLRKRKKQKIREKQARKREKKLRQKARRRKRREKRRIDRTTNWEEGFLARTTKKITSWCCEETINTIARETGFLKKDGAKITPLAFIITLSFSLFGDGSGTYLIISANLFSWFDIFVTQQALFARVSNKSTAKFIKEVFKIVVKSQLQLNFKNRYSKIFSMFTDVIIEDSTIINLNELDSKKFKGCGGSGKTSKSAAKLNTTISLCTNSVTNIDVVKGSKSDQALSKDVRKNIKKGQLWIRDLGYFSLKDLQVIIKMLAFFITKLKKDVIVRFEEDGEPVDMEKYLRENLKKGKKIDRIVYIGQMRLEVRLIAERVPKKVQQKRIENYKKNRIKRDKNKKMSDSYYEWFNYTIYITNIQESTIDSFVLIDAIYRTRWQIELFFKRVKSILAIDVIKGTTATRVECFIFAKLIAVLTAQAVIAFAVSICEEEEEISEDRVMSFLKNGNRLIRLVVFRLGDKNLLEDLVEIHHLLLKDKRKRKTTLGYIHKLFDKRNLDTERKGCAA